MDSLKKCAIKDMKRRAIGNIKGAVDKPNGYFIPFSNYNNSFGKVSGIVDTMKERVERRYPQEKYGRIAIKTKNSDGFTLEFKPTKILLDTAQGKLDKLRQDYYNRDAARRERGESMSSRQIKDNTNESYAQLLEFKQKQRVFIEKEITVTEARLRKKGDLEQEARLESLVNSFEDLNTQIKALESKNDEIFKKVVKADIEEIKTVLTSDDIYDLSSIKNLVDFYKTFADLVDKDTDPELDGELSKLFKKGENSTYNIELKKKVKKILEGDYNVRETLDYLNTSEDQNVLDLKATLVEKGLIEDKDSDITIDNLLYRNADINAIVENFATITDSYDNIIPQVVMSMMDNYQNKELNHVIDMVDDLKVLKEKNPDINPEDFFDEDNKLINIYTDKYSEALKKRYEYIDGFLYGKGSKAKRYAKIINWHKTNTDVIDFTKIPDIKTSFQKIYPEAFTNTDQEMQDYEQSLINRIGIEEYGKLKAKIKSQLNKYEQQKNQLDNIENPSDGDIAKVVRNNIWEFNKRYFSKGTQELNVIEQDGIKQFFSGFSNSANVVGIQYIPKEGKDKGFYSEKFKETIEDDNKYEMWRTYKEMLSYINDAYYNDIFDRHYMPQISKDLAEKVTEAWTDFKNSDLSSVNSLRKSVGHHWRELYYSKLPESERPDEKEIVSNNLDTSRAEVSKLAKVLRIQNPKLDEGRAYEEARKRLAPTYSQNIDKSIEASLVSASLHQARIRTEPVAAMFLETYKNIRSGKDGDGGKQRDKAINRFEHFIDKVVYNQINQSSRETDEGASVSKKFLYSAMKVLDNNSIPDKLRLFRSMKKGLKLFSAQEAEIVKVIEETVNQKRKDKGKEPIDFVDMVFGKGKDLSESEIEEIARELGGDLSIASMVEGVLKASIIKHLGFKPDSGLMNRVEGKNNNMIEDLRGEYWTTGNINVAHDMMAWSNISDAMKSVNKNYGQGKHNVKQMDIFRGLIERIGGLQDRKDELQKASKANTADGFISNAVFSWSVTKPEFKNQGAIMLAVMMDKTIVDDNGVEHPFINKENKEFTALDINEFGELVVKEGFKNSFSFDNQEISRENKGNDNLLAQISYKSNLSISAVQGNYSSMDSMKIKSSLAGKAMMNFMTWLPAQTIKRWGNFNNNGNIDINPATGKLKRDGMYVESFKGSKAVLPTKILADMGLAYGFLSGGLLGIGGILGVSVFSMFAAKTFLKDKNFSSPKADIADIGVLVSFLADTLKNTATYTPKLLASLPGMNQIVKLTESDKVNIKYPKKLSQEQVAATKSIAQELATKMNLLLYKMALGALLWDDDDPDASVKRRAHYFLQNLLFKNISAISLYSDPTQIWDEVTQMSVVNELFKIKQTITGVGKMFEGEFEEGFMETAEGLRNLVPLSTDVLDFDKRDGFTALKNPFLEPGLLETNPFIMNSNSLGHYEWARAFYKDFNTEGVYTLEKELRQKRKEIGDKVDSAFSNILTRDQLSAVKNKIKQERIPERPNNLSPQELKKYVEKVDPNTYLYEDWNNISKDDIEMIQESYKIKLSNALRSKGASEETIKEVLKIREEEF